MFWKVSESQSLKGKNRPVRNRKKPAKLMDSDDDTSKIAAESISKQDKEDKEGYFFISQAHISNRFNFNTFRNMKLSFWHTIFSFQLVFKF